MSQTQLTNDRLLRQFTQEGTRPSTLFAMSAAGLAGQVGRSLFLSSPLASFVPAILKSGLSQIAGLGFEASTLTAFYAIENGDHDLDLHWKTSMLQLAGLKFFSVLSHRQSLPLQHLFQSLGLVAGNRLSNLAGLTSSHPQTLTEELFHAEIMNLQWQAGMKLAQHLGVNHFQNIQRNLTLKIEVQNSPIETSLTKLKPLPSMASHPFNPHSEINLLSAQSLRRSLRNNDLSNAERQAIAQRYLEEAGKLPSNHSETAQELARGIMDAREAMELRRPEAFLLYPESMKILARLMTEGASGKFRNFLTEEGKQLLSALNPLLPEDPPKIASLQAFPHYLTLLLRNSRSPLEMQQAYDQGIKFIVEVSPRMKESQIPDYYAAAVEGVVRTFELLAPYFCAETTFNERLLEEIVYFKGMSSIHRFSKVSGYFLQAFPRLTGLALPSETLDEIKGQVILSNTEIFSAHPRLDLRTKSLEANLVLLESLPPQDPRTQNLRLYLYGHYHDLLISGEAAN